MSEVRDERDDMDNVLSYVVMKYIGVLKCVELSRVFGELVWRGIRRRMASLREDDLVSCTITDRELIKCIKLNVFNFADCLDLCYVGCYIKCVYDAVNDRKVAPHDKIALMYACIFAREWDDVV